MKTVAIVVGLAIFIISGIMISLVKKGGALKPAGVIKPAEIGTNPALIGQAVAVRLFPEFHAAKNVIWFVESSDGTLAEIPKDVLGHHKSSFRPGWFVVPLDGSIPDDVAKKQKDEDTVVIYIQTFNRDEAVSETCEKQKILEPSCVKPIAVREVRRKLKSSAPYYFMQRYQRHQFYLFLERDLG